MHRLPTGRVEIHMRKPGEEIPAGSLPVTHAVDMNTPIARQVRARMGAKAKISAPAEGRPAVSAPSVRPAAPAVKPPVSSPPQKERIPVAEPCLKPSRPRNRWRKDIPNAEPLEDDIPLAEPVVKAYGSVGMKGGLA